ncbi:MAG TPA: hypothetical protein G4O19_04500 [Dehalococcoidia bacterium]|nr:hypothetical protein [Dehalococcoidia bacterium]
MMESWTEPGFTKRGRGRMGIMGSIGTWLGVAFAIIGIIGETTYNIIGLSPLSWYFLAIAALIFGLTCWLGWAVGMYFHVKETQGEKEE